MVGVPPRTNSKKKNTCLKHIELGAQNRRTLITSVVTQTIIGEDMYDYLTSAIIFFTLIMRIPI